ncbi:hypothetical protein [Streptomyces sp. GESEQ-4]|uniref:hypothetical protein n=1 Tax=Streptomyces sp. GESEQ-4 TaxID=2812655 RepID=UPI001B31FE9C|nr:hypothetical protein [Streptomyces sp. GESEQ-4]
MKQYATSAPVSVVLGIPADRTDTTVEVLPAGSRVEAKAADAEFRGAGFTLYATTQHGDITARSL